MKTRPTPQPTHKKLPADRVMHLRQYSDYPKTLWPFGWGGEEPFACIATHTPAQAKQIVKAAEFMRLPEEEKVAAVVSAINENDCNYYGPAEYDDFVESTARAVLAAMGMGGEK